MTTPVTLQDVEEFLRRKREGQGISPPIPTPTPSAPQGDITLQQVEEYLRQKAGGIAPSPGSPPISPPPDGTTPGGPGPSTPVAAPPQAPQESAFSRRFGRLKEAQGRAEAKGKNSTLLDFLPVLGAGLGIANLPLDYWAEMSARGQGALGQFNRPMNLPPSREEIGANRPVGWEEGIRAFESRPAGEQFALGTASDPTTLLPLGALGAMRSAAKVPQAVTSAARVGQAPPIPHAPPRPRVPGPSIPPPTPIPNLPFQFDANFAKRRSNVTEAVERLEEARKQRDHFIAQGVPESRLGGIDDRIAEAMRYVRETETEMDLHFNRPPTVPLISPTQRPRIPPTSVPARPLSGVSGAEDIVDRLRTAYNAVLEEKNISRIARGLDPYRTQDEPALLLKDILAKSGNNLQDVYEIHRSGIAQEAGIDFPVGRRQSPGVIRFTTPEGHEQYYYGITVKPLPAPIVPHPELQPTQRPRIPPTSVPARPLSGVSGTEDIVDRLRTAYNTVLDEMNTSRSARGLDPLRAEDAPVLVLKDVLTKSGVNINDVYNLERSGVNDAAGITFPISRGVQRKTITIATPEGFEKRYYGISIKSAVPPSIPSPTVVPPRTPPIAPVLEPPATPDFAANIRLSKYPQEVRQPILDWANAHPDEIIEARRGVRSDAQVAEDAKALVDGVGGDFNKLKRRWKPGDAWNAEEITAIRGTLNQKTQDVLDAAAILKTDDSSAAHLRLAFALGEHGNIQDIVHGVTAEAGRSLRAFKKQAFDAMNSNDAQKMEALLKYACE